MCLSDTEKCFQTQKRLNNPPLIGAPKCRDGNKKQSRNGGAMCLSDTEKGFQTQKRLNNPSLIGAPKCRDGTGIGDKYDKERTSIKRNGKQTGG